MSFSNHRVLFSITQPVSSVNFSWALIDANPVKELSPSIIPAIAFTTFLLAAQMSVQFTNSALIFINILVYPFMAYVDIFSVF